MESTRFEALYPKEARFSEIEQMLSFIKSGNSCQIIGIPGVGRSNMLALLSFNRSARQHHLGVAGAKEFHFVYCNFSEVRKKPLGEVLKFIFISLIDSLKERIMTQEEEKVAQIFKESLEFSDELVLFQGLKKAIDFLAIEKERTIVLLLDRFEEYVPYITPELFQGLRSLRNRAKYRFSVVFSLSRPIEEILEPEIYKDMSELLLGNTIFLPLLDKPSLDFRISYIEKKNGNKIDKKELEKIVSLTGGHGKLTRVCSETYLSVDRQAFQRSRDLSSFFLSNERIRSVLLDIWKSLTPQEQGILASSHQQLATRYLENVGIVENGEIAIPIFKTFIGTLPQSDNSKIIYDEKTNEIKIGQTVLSEGLTSFEYKLLKFMVQNSDKTLERDDVINSVWGDLSSTAGVSEQALDQLIFRLRKKIEENPNQPTHLQTVKGRGFKFTPS